MVSRRVRSTVHRLQRQLRAERDEAAVYRALAEARQGEERRVLLALADAEERHAAHFAALLGGEGPARHRPGFQGRVLGWLARHGGGFMVLALMQRAELVRSREREVEGRDAIAADELVHSHVVAGLAQQGRTRAAGLLRATVFGVNDGLVSNTSLVLGLAGAGSSTEIVLLAGLAGLLAGALSMAAGEFVSVRSQRELLQSTAGGLASADRAALRRAGGDQVALVFRAEGMTAERAERAAVALLEDGVGSGEQRPAEGWQYGGLDVVGSDVGAAASSFAAFAVGAAVPVVPFLVTTGGVALGWAVALAGVALLIVGAVIGVLTGGPLLRRAVRQLAIGAAAATATYLLGTLLGVVVG
ncbi:MAG: VIT1/CCC1 transporter family protein [Egibacteraceae bacterium]